MSPDLLASGEADVEALVGPVLRFGDGLVLPSSGVGEGDVVAESEGEGDGGSVVSSGTGSTVIVGSHAVGSGNGTLSVAGGSGGGVSVGVVAAGGVGTLDIGVPDGALVVLLGVAGGVEDALTVPVGFHGVRGTPGSAAIVGTMAAALLITRCGFAVALLGNVPMSMFMASAITKTIRTVTAVGRGHCRRRCRRRSSKRCAGSWRRCRGSFELT